MQAEIQRIHGPHCNITLHLEVLCFIKKHNSGLKRNYEIHDHDTRSQYDLHTQPQNTSTLQKSVLHMGITLYKQLPLNDLRVGSWNVLSLYQSDALKMLL